MLKMCYPVTLRYPLKFNRIRKDKLSNTYGKFANRKSGAHWGWDFEAQVGTPIYAIADGIISEVYGSPAADQGFGLVVELAFQYHGVTYYAGYCHLQRSVVAKGNMVKQGQLLGYTGKSGNAYDLPTSEDHLHFEIRSRSRPGLGGHPDRLDPIQFYNAAPIGHSIIESH